MGEPAGARVRVAVFLLGMCALVTAYATQPLLARIASWAGVPEAQAAWTVSAATLGVAVMAPVAGAVSDRLGRKRVMLVAIAVILGTTVLCVAAPDLPALLAVRFVQGLATPFVFAVVVAYIGEEFEGRDAVRLGALSVAGTAFGGFAGRLLPGLVADVAGDWRAGFWPLTGLLGLALLTTWAWLPRERRFARSGSFTARGAAHHLRDPRVLATCVVGAGLLFQQVASFTFLSIRLQAPGFGLTSLQVGLVFVVMVLPVVITPQVGSAVARFGRAPVFAASTLLGVAGILVTVVPSVPAVIAGLACSCIAVFAGQACATGFLAGHADRDASAAVGLYLTSYYLGGTIGGIAPAPLFTAAGWSAAAALIVVVTVLSASLGLAAWRRGGGRALRPR